MAVRAKTPRLAVRAIILHDDRLLLVNAYPGEQSDLWCAPGGGVEPGQSLPDNLRREVHEETGLRVAVGAPVLVNEFHEPASGFHQVEVFFRCRIEGSADLPQGWADPEDVVNRRRFVTRGDLAGLRVKPDSLADVVWGHAEVAFYDPLELLAR